MSGLHEKQIMRIEQFSTLKMKVQPATRNHFLIRYIISRKLISKWLKQKNQFVDFLTIMKGQWFEGQFRAKSASTKWKTSKFRKSVQIMVMLLSRVFERKDGASFLDKWIPIIYQIIKSIYKLNWGELISSNLDIQLNKAQKDHQFFMSSYLMNVMCASIEFPSLGWKWEPSLPSVHVYCKILWENKYKEDYELICNGLFSTLYQVLFSEEAPCLSNEGLKIVKEYGGQYMTPDRVYIKISGSKKPPHQLPHLVPDTFLLQEISYQTYVNGVDASLHQNKKGLWPLFPLITQVCNIETFKQAKDEVGVLTFYKFKEVIFRRNDRQGKLKEHLQQVRFIWSYSHEYMLPGELSQHQLLVKSQIPTIDQMTKIDKEAKIKKTITEKNKTSIEQNVGCFGEDPSLELLHSNKPLDHQPFQKQAAMQPTVSLKVTYGGVWTHMSTLTRTGNLMPILNI